MFYNNTWNNHTSTLISPWYQGFELKDEVFYIVITMLCVYVIVGIPGNLLIVVSLLKNRRQCSNYNILVGNLAVSDLILTAYVVVFDAVDLLYGRFPGPFVMCQFNAFVLISLKFVSISSLMVIAVDRYCQICYFTKCDRIFSRRNTYIICTVQWVCGWLLAGLPLSGWSTLTYDKLIHECSYDRFASTLCTVMIVVLAIAIPITVSLVCYVKILMTISRRNSKVRCHLHSSIQKRHAREIRSVKTQLAVFIAFMIFTSPYGLTAMFADASEDLLVLHAMVNMLGHANSVINCFIYGIMNKSIRKEYKEIILCNKKDHQKEIIGAKACQKRIQNTETVIEESML